MPPFTTLATDKVDASRTADKMRALRSIGVPYEAKEIQDAAVDEKTQATEIAENLRLDGASASPDSELVALIAYLQRLGAKPQSQSPVNGGRVSLAK